MKNINHNKGAFRPMSEALRCLIILAVFFAPFRTLNAQSINVDNSGINVPSGTYITMGGSMVIQNSGAIDNSGAVKLSGD